MAIRFVIPNGNVRAVRFAVSPLLEATLSLNAYLFPRHRSLQHKWIRSMRTLPTALRREIEAFGFVLDWAVPDCVLPTPARRIPTWDEELRRVARIDPSRAGYELLRPSFYYALSVPAGPSVLEREDVRNHVLARAGRYGARGRALARQAFDRPADALARFVAMLDEYWGRAFGAEWSRLERRLLAVARHDARTVAERGFYSVLDGRFADTVVDATAGWFERASPHDHTVRPTRRQPVTLIPSFFVWPHVRVNCDAPWPLSVIYPPGDIRAEAYVDRVPPTLVAELRALSEPARLQLLHAIAARSRSTEELAHLVGLSPAGTSKHLRSLAEAGLVTRRRDGYYVLYALAEGRLRDVADELLAFVTDPRSPSVSGRR